MAFDVKDKKNKAIVQFIQSQVILVVDTVNSSRNALRKMLLSTAVDQNQLEVVDNFSDAKEYFEGRSPQIVFADLDIAGHSGMEFLDMLKKVYPNPTKRGFLVLTNGESPAVMSTCLEGDVDEIVSRPFTFDSLQTAFMNVINAKAEPSDQDNQLGLIEEDLIGERFQEVVSGADPVKASSAKAAYLQGLAKIKLGDAEGALSCLQEAFKKDNNYYPGAVTYFDQAMELKKVAEAQVVGDHLLSRGPISPKRIPALVRLYILSKKWDSIEKIYGMLETLGTSNSSINGSLAAGLVLCGKQYIAEGEGKRGVEVLGKAEKVSEGRIPILVEIATILVKAGKDDLVQDLLLRVSDEVRDDPKMRLAEFEMIDHTKNAGEVIKFAEILVTQGIEDIVLHEAMLKRSIEIGRRDSVINELIEKAKAAYPDKVAHFDELVAEARENAAGEEDDEEYEDEED